METKTFILGQNKFGSGSTCSLNNEAVLMCPKCFNTIMVVQNGFIEVTNMDGTEYCDMLVTPRYHCECPVCHESAEFAHIDMLMRKVVPSLNKLGFTTAMSCNSHEGDIYNFMIKFTKMYRFSTLPDGFILDGLFLKLVNTSMTREQAIEKLEAWVDKLGECPVLKLLSNATGDR